MSHHDDSGRTSIQTWIGERWTTQFATIMQCLGRNNRIQLCNSLHVGAAVTTDSPATSNAVALNIF